MTGGEAENRNGNENPSEKRRNDNEKVIWKRKIWLMAKLAAQWKAALGWKEENGSGNESINIQLLKRIGILDKTKT